MRIHVRGAGFATFCVQVCRGLRRLVRRAKLDIGVEEVSADALCDISKRLTATGVVKVDLGSGERREVLADCAHVVFYYSHVDRCVTPTA